MSVRVEVKTNDQFPTGIPLGPLTTLIWTPPEQLLPSVSQNWFGERTEMFPTKGSSGGLSSLLTKSPELL